MQCTPCLVFCPSGFKNLRKTQIRKMTNVMECFDGFKKYLKTRINSKLAPAYEKYAKQYRDYCVEMKLSMDENPEGSILKFLQSLLDEGNQCGTIKLYRRGIYYLYQAAEMEPNPSKDRFCMRIEDIAMQLSKRENKTAATRTLSTSSTVSSDDIPGIQAKSKTPSKATEIKKKPASPVNAQVSIKELSAQFKDQKPFRVDEFDGRFFDQYDEYCRKLPCYNERYVSYLKLFRSYCQNEINVETVTKDNINRFIASRFKSARGLDYSAFKERLDVCFDRLITFVGSSIDVISPAKSVLEYLERRLNPRSYLRPVEPELQVNTQRNNSKDPVTFEDSVEMEIDESPKYDSTFDIQTQEQSATETADYPFVIHDTDMAEREEMKEMPRINKMPIIEDLPEHKQAPSVAISETPSARVSESITAEESVDVLKWKAFNALIERGDIEFAKLLFKDINK